MDFYNKSERLQGFSNGKYHKVVYLLYVFKRKQIKCIEIGGVTIYIQITLF